MRVLITGISGFIGRHLASALAAEDLTLCGLSVDGAQRVAGARVHEVDLLDDAGLARALDAFAPDVVVHLAALSHVGSSWERPGDYYRVNFLGTRNLLRAARGRKVVFASSAEVYGFVPEDQQPIAEDRLLDPRSPYAMTKACAETIARDHGAVAVRAFNVVGAGQSRCFALPSFAAQLAAIGAGEREPVLRVGDLSPRRDFLHVADAVAGYRVLIEQGRSGEVYNLASGEDRSIREALDKLLEISGVAAAVTPDEGRMRPVENPVLRGDSGRLRALGWEPRHGFDQALREIWEEAIGPPARSPGYDRR